MEERNDNVSLSAIDDTVRGYEGSMNLRRWSRWYVHEGCELSIADVRSDRVG